MIVAGDMNEYTAARAVLRPLAAHMHDANDAARVPRAERYTYAYDQHAQEIDHVFVSGAVAARGADVEHVHVNTWARTVGERASDHDPTIVRLWVCDAPEIGGAYRTWISVDAGIHIVLRIVNAKDAAVVVEEAGANHGQVVL